LNPLPLEAKALEATRAALGRHDGNVIAAADELGMSRSALYRRMEKFGL
jgi:transcriptional regulator of acetoin/glycerol metabolism